MTTRLSDVILTPVYDSFGAMPHTENDALINSGIIQVSPVTAALAKAGNKDGVIPFWNPLNRNEEPDYSNDDPADKAVPGKITTGQMKYRKRFLHKSYASMDLVAELMGQDPVAAIKARFNDYWIGQRQRTLIATARGVLAANVAKNGGDMVVDISAAAGDSAKWSGEAFIDAAFTMGDAVSNLKAVAMHSAVAGAISKTNEIETIRGSDGKVLYQVYKDKIVIVDDTLPVEGTGADRVFTSILFGTGSFSMGSADGHTFAFGEGEPQNPSYVTRDESAGNGGGMEVIGERKTWILHPLGMSWADPGGADALVEFSPTYADLAKAAGWTRVAPRKAVPLAFLKTKI